MRYVIMAGANYYPGGACDIRGACKTEEGARRAGETLAAEKEHGRRKYDWVSIVDLEELVTMDWWHDRNIRDCGRWEPLEGLQPLV